MRSFIIKILSEDIDILLFEILNRISRAWCELFHDTPIVKNVNSKVVEMEKVQLLDISGLYDDYEALFHKLGNGWIFDSSYRNCTALIWYPYNWEKYLTNIDHLSKDDLEIIKIKFDIFAIQLQKRGMVIENELLDPRDFYVWLSRRSC